MLFILDFMLNESRCTNNRISSDAGIVLFIFDFKLSQSGCTNVFILDPLAESCFDTDRNMYVVPDLPIKGFYKIAEVESC